MNTVISYTFILMLCMNFVTKPGSAQQMKIISEPGLVGPVFKNAKSFESFVLQKFEPELSSVEAGLYVCLTVGTDGVAKNIKVNVSPESASNVLLGKRITEFIRKYARWSPAYRIKRSTRKYLQFNDCYMIKEIK